MEQIKKLHNTIQDLVKVRGEDKLSISDECLFDNAVKIFISNSIQESKSQSSHGEPVGKEVGRFSPSPKQLKLLYDAGLNKEIIDKMSKEEVSKVIGEYLKNLKKENI